jgi:LEA14-like dessication related protein
MFRIAVVIAVALAGCHGTKSPEVHVIGVHETSRREVVFVEVTNPASKPMRLTKLEYKFAAAGATLSEGELPLARDVPAGAAIIVEVPLDTDPNQAMTLSGRLTAELDQIVRTFQVSAQIQPHS